MDEDELTYKPPALSLGKVEWKKDVPDASIGMDEEKNETPGYAISYPTSTDLSYVPPSTRLETTLADTFKLVRRWYNKTTLKANGCREWNGAFSDSLYGTISVLGKTHLVHRFSYQLFHGDIPDGMLVCHKCDNPKCCQPDHLFLGNASANMKDASEKGRLRNTFAKGGGREESTIDESAVRAIRILSKGGMSAREIGDQYGVKPSIIRDILNGRTWSDVI